MSDIDRLVNETKRHLDGMLWCDVPFQSLDDLVAMFFDTLRPLSWQLRSDLDTELECFADTELEDE